MQHASTLHQSQTPWKMSAPERIRMFLWRIGVNVRAKENMLRRLEVTDSKCVLCGEEVKITCHIFFFKCLVAEAVWHSACWGFRTDEFWISSNEDIVNLVLNPPNLSCTANEIWLVSLIWLLLYKEYGAYAIMSCTMEAQLIFMVPFIKFTTGLWSFQPLQTNLLASLHPHRLQVGFPHLRIRSSLMLMLPYQLPR